MGGGCGPNCITFTINTLLANLTDEDKESIEESITEILQGLGSGNVTFSEFREGPVNLDASTQNFVSAEAVSEVVKEAGNIKTLGTQRFIVAKINEAPVEYTDKLIIVPTDDDADIRYINVGAEDTVERTDWEAQGIATEAIKSVAFSNSVETIGVGAFPGCTSLTQVTIPNSVETIGLLAFAGCISLTEVTIPNSVTTIGVSAFRGCTSLTEVTIPNSVQTIELGAFSDCTSLTQVTIPNSVTTIGESAFQQCTSLTQVTIPNSVQTIGESAFRECTSLTQVTIPNSVETIGDFAFVGCTSLTEIIVDGANASYSSVDGVLFNKNKTELIQCPIGNTRTSYTIPNSVETIGKRAFGICTSLTEVTIPNSVQTIRQAAFLGCTSLTQVTIPNSVTTIGSQAFAVCTSLTQVTIPNSVETIGDRAFRGCTSLARVILNSNIAIIDADVFAQCPAVSDPTDFVVPNARTQKISFQAGNGDFSNRGTGAGTLQFGADNSGGPGFKTVTVFS
jgi:Flp pilus assembly protein protease CpaA